jgi:putative oxidoreductase
MYTTALDSPATTRAERSALGSTGLLVLRLAAGLCLLEHGLPKLAHPSGFVHALGGLGVPLPQVSGWLEILGEVGLGLLLVLGLLTRVAGALMAIQMSLVWITVHLPKGWAWGRGFDGELALLLAVIGVTLLFTGAGAWSLDATLPRRRPRPSHGADPIDGERVRK